MIAEHQNSHVVTVTYQIVLKELVDQNCFYSEIN